MKLTPSQIIKKHRRDAGLSQEQLAEKLNINPKTVRNWERGVTEPGLSQGSDVAKILSFSMAEFDRSREGRTAQDNNVQVQEVEKPDTFLERILAEACFNKWLEKRKNGDTKNFSAGFNQIALNSLQYYYGDDFDLNECQIMCFEDLFLVTHEVCRRGYHVVETHTGDVENFFFTVYLKNKREAEQFTEDLYRIIVAVVSQDETVDQKYLAKINALRKTFQVLMREAIEVDVSVKNRYVATVFEENGEPNEVQAGSAKELVEKLEYINPKDFSLYVFDGSLRRLNTADSRKLLAKLKKEAENE